MLNRQKKDNQNGLNASKSSIGVGFFMPFFILSFTFFAFQNCSPGIKNAYQASEATSGYASLSQSGDILITSQPQSLTIQPGESFTLGITAESKLGRPLTYQWYKDDSPIEELTTNQVTVANAQSYQKGSYRCEVSDGNSTANSQLAVIQFNSKGVYFFIQPSSAEWSLSLPGKLTSLAKSNSGSTISYQWFKDETAISGQTGPNLSLYPVLATDAGTYYVRADDGSGFPAKSQEVVVSIVGGTGLSEVTIDVSNYGACGGYCSCVSPGNINVPYQPSADALCKKYGYTSASQFTTLTGPEDVLHCAADGSGCFTNQNPGNIICATVTCH